MKQRCFLRPGNPEVSEALAQLQHAMEDSVSLMNREYYAMRLVIDAKGDTDIPDTLKEIALSAKDAALSPEEKMKRATEMVLDNEYYEQKDRIRSEMKESLLVLESFTRNTEYSALNDLQNVMNIIRIINVASGSVRFFRRSKESNPTDPSWKKAPMNSG